VNGVIFGVFSTLFFGLAYYMVPKLTGIRMHREEWSKYPILLWNGTLLIAFLSLPGL
jgi:cytochrome c oxidase cbb3-type subunit 1